MVTPNTRTRPTPAAARNANKARSGREPGGTRRGKCRLAGCRDQRDHIFGARHRAGRRGRGLRPQARLAALMDWRLGAHGDTSGAKRRERPWQPTKDAVEQAAAASIGPRLVGRSPPCLDHRDHGGPAWQHGLVATERRSPGYGCVVLAASSTFSGSGACLERCAQWRGQIEPTPASALGAIRITRP